MPIIAWMEIGRKIEMRRNETNIWEITDSEREEIHRDYRIGRR
jgi:hypothetical protein